MAEPQVLMTEERPHLPAVYTDGHIVNGRGQKLFTATHKPLSGEPKAILLWHHGLSEHISRALHVFPSFAAVGVAVYGFDAHGHGKSEPTDKIFRSYVDTYEHLLDDLSLRLKSIQDEYKDAGKTLPPVFVGGNSLGGLVAGLLVARSPPKTFAGLVMQSPLIDIEWTAGLRIQAKIGAFLSYTFPKSAMVPAVRPEDMSQDPKIVKEYLDDPLIYTDKVKCRTAYESLKAMAAFQKLIPKLDVPLYIAHGTSDRCTSAPAAKLFFEKSSNPDKKFNDVEGGYHELLFGPEHKQVIHDMVTWIVEHATGVSATPAPPAAIAAAVTDAAAATATAVTDAANTATTAASGAVTTAATAATTAVTDAVSAATTAVTDAASTATTAVTDAATAATTAVTDAATAATTAVTDAATAATTAVTEATPAPAAVTSTPA